MQVREKFGRRGHIPLLPFLCLWTTRSIRLFYPTLSFLYSLTYRLVPCLVSARHSPVVIFLYGLTYRLIPLSALDLIRRFGAGGLYVYQINKKILPSPAVTYEYGQSRLILFTHKNSPYSLAALASRPIYPS